MAKGSKKKDKRKNKGSQGGQRSQGPPVSSLAYSGPCIGAIRSKDDVLVCMEFREIASITTGGGVTTYSAAFANDPTGVPEWSSIAALFDGFRVLAMEIRYIPASYTGTALTGATLLCVLDYEDTTVLASQTAALQYDSVAFRNIGTTTDPLKVGWTFGPWRAKGSNLMMFNPVSATVPTQNRGSIKFRADSLTASTGYGAVVCYRLVQLRGRQ